MPIYVYQCPQCKTTREVFHASAMGLFHAQTCDKGCKQLLGAREIPALMDRVPTAPAIQFKGGGWASDGYSKGGK